MGARKPCGSAAAGLSKKKATREESKWSTDAVEEKITTSRVKLTRFGTLQSNALLGAPAEIDDESNEDRKVTVVRETSTSLSGLSFSSER